MFGNYTEGIISDDTSHLQLIESMHHMLFILNCVVPPDNKRNQVLASAAK